MTAEELYNKVLRDLGATTTGTFVKTFPGSQIQVKVNLYRNRYVRRRYYTPLPPPSKEWILVEAFVARQGESRSCGGSLIIKKKFFLPGAEVTDQKGLKIVKRIIEYCRSSCRELAKEAGQFIQKEVDSENLRNLMMERYSCKKVTVWSSSSQFTLEYDFCRIQIDKEGFVASIQFDDHSISIKELGHKFWNLVPVTSEVKRSPRLLRLVGGKDEDEA